jgi:2-dehydro-3-deoxyglucarate aldolase/4-hydroxy-2-oxoheptanedioate aldolase
VADDIKRSEIMNSSGLKSAWREGKLTVGTWVLGFATPGIARLLASTGVDFVVYDQEHSAFGIDTIRGLLAETRPLNLVALVRPPANEYHLIAPVLDAGASGVIIPNVQTASEAKRVTDACRYFPRGQRGGAFSLAHDDFLPGDVMGKIQAANDAMICGVLIESRQGVENVEDIVAVEGVDLVWVGFIDLSLSMGIPGQYHHPEFERALSRIVKVCNAHKKPAGILSNDPEQAKNYVQQGFHCICYGGEVWLLQRALSEGIQSIRRARVSGDRLKTGGGVNN